MAIPMSSAPPKGSAANWGAGFLPSVYQGTWLKPSGAPIDNLAVPASLTPQRQRAQLDQQALKGGLGGDFAEKLIVVAARNGGDAEVRHHRGQFQREQHADRGLPAARCESAGVAPAPKDLRFENCCFFAEIGRAHV